MFRSAATTKCARRFKISRSLATESIRERFLSGEDLDPSQESRIREPILRSWRRARLAGATDRSARLPFDSAVVSDSVLMQAAEPVLTKLAEDLVLDQSSLLVADRHAHILRTWTPDPTFRKKMERIGSLAGHSGAESVVGTNGVGTPIEEGRPYMVIGAEHTADVLTDDACFGAPVYSPISRRLQGVITLTTMVKDASPLLPGLINHAARMIGDRMLDLSSIRERVLLEKFLVTSKQSKRTAVVSGDILLESPGASEHLRDINQQVLWATISDSISTRHPKRILHFPTETSVIEILCSAVVFNDQVIGAIIEVLDQAESPLAKKSAAQEPPSERWTPLSASLPGTSPAWLSTLEQAEAAMKAKIPVVVFGAPGTGKTTLLLKMLEQACPGHRPLILDATMTSDNADEWIGALQSGLREPAPLVLKHIGALDDATARRVVEAILQSPRLLELGLLHGTSSAQSLHPFSEEHQALLDILAVGRIDMPNLRERKQDFRVLLKALERKFAPTKNITYTQGAFNALTRAPWPGNLRQLESMMRGVFALGRTSEITIDQLPPTIAEYAARRDLTMLEQLEVDGIINALIKCGGNKVVAAEMLGVSRSTLYRKMGTYKLDAERFFF